MFAALCLLLAIGHPDAAQSQYERASRESALISRQEDALLDEVWQPLIDFLAAEIDWDRILASLKDPKGDASELLVRHLVDFLPPASASTTPYYTYVSTVLNTGATIHVNVRFPIRDRDFGVHQNFCRVLFVRQPDSSWSGEFMQAIGFPQSGGDTWQLGQGALADGRIHFIGAEQEYSTGGKGGIEVWEKSDGRWNRVQHIISKYRLGPYDGFVRRPDGSYDVSRVVMRTQDLQPMTFISNLGPFIYREEVFVLVDGRYKSQGVVPYDSALRSLEDMLAALKIGDLKSVRKLCLSDEVYDQFISVDFFSEPVYAYEAYDEGDWARFPPSDSIELSGQGLVLTFSERDDKRRLAKIEPRSS